MSHCTDHNHKGCGCAHHHHHEHEHSARGNSLTRFIPEIISGVLMVASVIFFHYVNPTYQWIEWLTYLLIILPVGLPILKMTGSAWAKGDFFNEFTLMLLASVGAFVIGEYPEGVAVLLFYSLGEKLEDVVSGDVRRQIRGLIGKMPRKVTVIYNGQQIIKAPEDVAVGETISVKPGESIPLDGVLISCEEADLDTSAMTGESLPRTFRQGQEIPAGVIPVDKSVLLQVSKVFKDSSMSRIMKMIEDASNNQAPSESVLRRITRWYTPLVMCAAVLLFVIPWFIGLVDSGFTFLWADWLRRSLIFLVCSCPCALVVSIPLTYFASIGIASREGILFKGHRQLDDMRKITMILFDKTGTITTGRFSVSQIDCFDNCSASDVLKIATALEKESAHPLAKAIVNESSARDLPSIDAHNVETVSHGMKGIVDNHNILVGSKRLMTINGIAMPHAYTDLSTTDIYVASDGKCIARIALSDTLKSNSAQAIQDLHNLGIKEIGILSGDRTETVKMIARDVDADFFRAELLPEQKESIIKEYYKKGYKTAFAGDGINDGPALATANVGIAMGTFGSDLAIESADVVIAGDDLKKIPQGIKTSRKVKALLTENITFAFGVKLVVMILGAFGIASLWAAVFADTGVTLTTVLWTLCRLKIWKLRTPLKKK